MNCLNKRVFIVCFYKLNISVSAPPSIRLPRQYEDGLLFELGEIVRLKVSVTGRPQPTVTWFHNGDMLYPNNRVELASTEKYAMLRIIEAQREDRGEYQIKAKNSIGDDSASFLVTITGKQFNKLIYSARVTVLNGNTCFKIL